MTDAEVLCIPHMFDLMAILKVTLPILVRSQYNSHNFAASQAMNWSDLFIPAYRAALPHLFIYIETYQKYIKLREKAKYIFELSTSGLPKFILQGNEFDYLDEIETACRLKSFL